MNINGKDIKSVNDYLDYLSANDKKWKRREQNKKYFIEQLKKGKSFKKNKDSDNQAKLF